jgi:hypothetical protein
LRVINALQVAGHLLTEETARERLVRGPTKLDGPTVLDRDDECASVGAIVRADGPDLLQGEWCVHETSSGQSVVVLGSHCTAGAGRPLLRRWKELSRAFGPFIAGTRRFRRLVTEPTFQSVLQGGARLLQRRADPLLHTLRKLLR